MFNVIYIDFSYSMLIFNAFSRIFHTKLNFLPLTLLIKIIIVKISKPGLNSKNILSWTTSCPLLFVNNLPTKNYLSYCSKNNFEKVSDHFFLKSKKLSQLW